MTGKSRTAKLPRKVAGVKIPKEVRRSALGDFVNSPIGRALITEAVIAALALIARHEVKRRGEKHRGKAGARALSHHGEEGVNLAPATLAFAFSEAGRAFATALRGHHHAQPAAASPDDDWPADFESQGPRARRVRGEAAAARPH